MNNPQVVDYNPLSEVPVLLNMGLKETEQILAKGTGFIYERKGKVYLITNWHNVTGLNPSTKKPNGNHGGIPNEIAAYFQIQTKPYITWKQFTIGLYDYNGKADWLVHPVFKEKVDVVALEIENPDDHNSIFYPINNIKFDKYKPSVADDVFVLGFPDEISGGGHFPIWKKGSIATEPDIDLNGLPKFYIDTASRKGMSGSPVIFRRFGIHGTKDGKLLPNSIIGEVRNFIGIYSGRILGQKESELNLGIIWKARVIDEIIDGNLKDTILF